MTNNHVPNESIVVAVHIHRKSRRRRTAVITAADYSVETLCGKMCPVEIEELGEQLRRRRVTASRTIASIAAEAGLSVPYIANLENGRGNPTLSAVNRLAAALGVRLTLQRHQEQEQPVQALPDTLVQFSSSPRFLDEATQLARVTGAAEEDTRGRLLSAMAAMGEVAGKPLRELDWHRILDTVVLITRN
jgi:transcriptional regulator with XRE-family HTH domain